MIWRRHQTIDEWAAFPQLANWSPFPPLPDLARGELVRLTWYPCRYALREALHNAGARSGDMLNLTLSSATLVRDGVELCVLLRRLFPL